MMRKGSLEQPLELQVATVVLKHKVTSCENLRSDAKEQTHV